MQRLGSTTVLSPSDLTNRLACEHLTQLQLRALRGEIGGRSGTTRTSTSSGGTATSTRRPTSVSWDPTSCGFPATGRDADPGARRVLLRDPRHEARRKAKPARVPGGVRVGTVDLFQGLQAPVVFFAMASFSGRDAPRGLEFLFSRNRLNVAVSRAQALAVPVCAPVLLDAQCSRAEELPLVDGLCRLVESAERW